MKYTTLRLIASLLVNEEHQTDQRYRNSLDALLEAREDGILSPGQMATLEHDKEIALEEYNQARAALDDFMSTNWK